jgi:hypothetical protein
MIHCCSVAGWTTRRRSRSRSTNRHLREQVLPDVRAIDEGDLMDPGV